jgi:hypothetical protein
MTAGSDPRHNAALLRQHLDRLLPLIQEGALRGQHYDLRHLRRAEVQALLDTAAPHYRDAETSVAFQAAGEALVYGALLLACIQRVEMLDALGEDTIADKARLCRCLTHPLPTTETAPAP